jgi:hypothetical protein
LTFSPDLLSAGRERAIDILQASYYMIPHEWGVNRKMPRCKVRVEGRRPGCNKLFRAPTKWDIISRFSGKKVRAGRFSMKNPAGRPLEAFS